MKEQMITTERVFGIFSELNWKVLIELLKRL